MNKKVKSIAKKIAAFLKQAGCVRKVHVGGSIGRGEPDPQDVDLAVVATEGACAAQRMKDAPGVTKVRACGPKHCRVDVDDVKVDAWFGAPEEEGALRLFVEGPVNFEIAMRQAAKKHGYKLTRYGLFDAKNNSLVEGHSFNKILDLIGMSRFVDKARRRKRFTKKRS